MILVGCGSGDTANAFTVKPVDFCKQLAPESGVFQFFRKRKEGVFMVLVEGLKMKTKRIPKNQLTAAWKTLTRRPFPKVKALKLSDDDFNHVLEHMHCPEDSLREIEEWGRTLSTRGTDACVFNADEADDCRLCHLGEGKSLP